MLDIGADVWPMRKTKIILQSPLRRQLMPLAYALVVVVAFILFLTWGALKIQVTLAGYLNSESVWSKAQKQAVIDLQNYAMDGSPAGLAAFRDNYSLLQSDSWARDAVSRDHFDEKKVSAAFVRGNVMPTAVRGMIFMLEYFPDAPHVKEALTAWRSTDQPIDDLNDIATQLQQAYAIGSATPKVIALQRTRINRLNRLIEPRADLFSLEIAHGAVWLAHVLFYAVLAASCIALLMWLGMARRILATVRGTEERYRLLFDSAGDAIVMVDESTGRILDANSTLLDWVGRRRADLIGDRFAHLFMHSMQNKAGRSATNALLAPDGSMRPVETQSSLVSWGSQSVRQAIIRDISERLAMEQERRVAAEALASIAEGVIIADADRRVISVNAAHTAITGYSLEQIQGMRMDAMRTQPNGTKLPQSVWDRVASGHYWMGEVQTTHRDGTTYPEQLSISAIRDAEGGVLHYVAVFTNIFTSKVNQRRLEHLARHDPLTGLINRAEFEHQCTEAIATAERERMAIAVLFIDLDAFKIVNDSYSHAVGDQLLTAVAGRIREQLSENDVAGRIGGDEFTVLIRGLSQREDARAVASRLLAALAEPLLVADYGIVLTASIGVAGYPLDGSDALSLIANADAAMYAAKSEERNAFRFYTPVMHADTRRRLELAAEMRQALEREEFRLVYQPSVEMSTGRIVAVEALVRWNHPDRGQVMPSEFIPVAEGLGMIRGIDEWVLKAACEQIHAWDCSGMPPIRVAVNVSARWFGHPAFVDSVSRALQARNTSPKRLLLEITESAMLRLGGDTERTMQVLHSLGIEVAIDDFGTGYSSMAYLKLPAVTYLKIDRSFITGLPSSSNDVAIAEAMLAMSRSLGLVTIAEGIETEAQHEFLVRAGCMEGQGYLYSYPLEPDNLEQLLRPKHASVITKLRLVPPKRSR